VENLIELEIPDQANERPGPGRVPVPAVDTEPGSSQRPDHGNIQVSPLPLPPAWPSGTPVLASDLIQSLLQGKGDSLPVSAFPADGTYPLGTAALEKRNIAQEVPVWEPDLCIQCGKCVMVCPHAAIRAKAYPLDLIAQAPHTFKHVPAKWRELPEHVYTIQ